MTTVVSLGSINVDRVQYISSDEIRSLENKYDWFPSGGQTVRVDEVPESIAAGESENFIGGKGANQAVAAANIASEVTLLGSVGSDKCEYDVISTLSDRGVTVDTVHESQKETGKAYIFVDEAGESWIAIVGGANTTVNNQYINQHYHDIRNSDVLLIQNEIPVRPVTSLLDRLAGEPSRPTIICNPAPTDGAAPLMRASAVDFLVVNESEYEALTRECRQFSGTLIKTQGGDDVLVRGNKEFQVTPPKANPVDTTGAGDVFCGYIAAHLGEGRSIRRAVEDATVAATRSTEVEGAQEAISNLEAHRRRVGQ
jgi:ribokinase